MPPLQGAQVRCLVRELKSYMPSSVAKNLKKKKKKQNLSEKKIEKKWDRGREETPGWGNTKRIWQACGMGLGKMRQRVKNNLHFSSAMKW